LFEFSRHLPIPFEEFVARVDICAAVRMMNDNIGGACVPVATDQDSRITHQVERNIYLPQPNWMVLFGGKVIDVGKLEYIRYAADRQQIFWRTVVSANDSALFDDGLVTFARDEAGKTAITIVARQQFTLPVFWQVMNMDFMPHVKDALVSEAYTTFFSRTMANFEAAFEGRAVGTGRCWNAKCGERGATGEQLPLEQMAEGFVKLVGVIEPLVGQWLDHRNPASVDEHGCGHFAGKQLVNYIESEFADKFLTHLLKSMSLLFSLSRELRKNIEGFNGRYLFRISDRNIAVTADFHKNRMNVYEKEADNTNVAVTFKNHKALMNFLLSPKPDIIGSILRQDVTIDGNLSYLLKFAYMANHLRSMMTGRM
jgi:hypothetical protein